MSNQMITLPLLVDLSAEEQQFLAGGGSNCGGASMYVGHKITVTPFSKCVGGKTGGCS